MALAELNLDPPSPALGPSNRLHQSVARPDDFLIPSFPDFTEVVFSAFRSAPSSRPDRVARTLAAMADAQEKGLGNMPSVEPCISSLIVSPDEAFKQEPRCPNPECRHTDDLLVRIYNTVSISEPVQIFGPAAQEALERRERAAESRSQHIGCSMSYPALAAQRLPARHSTLQQHRQGQSYRPL